jgi:hypothetical protein
MGMMSGISSNDDSFTGIEKRFRKRFLFLCFSVTRVCCAAGLCAVEESNLHENWYGIMCRLTA